MHSAPTHLCRFPVRFSSRDSFRCSFPFLISSSFHFPQFLDTSFLRMILLPGSSFSIGTVIFALFLFETPHLASPFSFPLGTVLPDSIFSSSRNLWVYGRMDSSFPFFSLLMSTFSLLIAILFEILPTSLLLYRTFYYLSIQFLD